MEKLEPRLQSLLEDRFVRASDYGLTAAEVAEEPIDVTISHAERLVAPIVEMGPDSSADQENALNDVRGEAGNRNQAIIDVMEGMDAQGVELLPLANAVAASLTSSQLEEVSHLDEVELIRWDVQEDVACMTESTRLIEAFEVWRDLRIRGDGVKVAVLDSGVDKTHPALKPAVIDEVSLTTEPVSIPGSHGTHVAGTVASRDPIYKGVAPDAQIINVKVLTASNSGQPKWVIRGLEEAVRRGARVANLSLGWSEIYHNWYCNDADCILCVAADNASRLGVLVVVAAGNENNAASGFPGKFNVRHPGAAREVLTVASVDKAKKLASSSSIGPGSGRAAPGSTFRLTKPDVAAPGVAIMSTIPGGSFAAFSGTSMAAPHVAGLAALVIQRHPEVRPTTLKKLIEHTCEPLTNPPLEVGYGLVNAYSAVAHQ